jgi:hypothetical protein
MTELTGTQLAFIGGLITGFAGALVAYLLYRAGEILEKQDQRDQDDDDE